MDSKISKLKEERKKIIESYSSKSILDTYIDKVVKEITDTLYVKVKEIVEETPDTKSFILVPNSEAGTRKLRSFRAGSYISVKLNIDDMEVSRAYSLSSSPKMALKDMYRITIKRVEDGLVSNYMLDQVKVGDTLEISLPMGDFGYNSLRDEKNVIGVCGGSGVTPFMALAYAINDGLYDCNMTVFYSVKREEDIIFKKEIEEINKRSKKVKFIITLTREENKKYLSGHINREMIEPYIKEFNTILMCGPKALYQTMNEILSEFNIPKKCVHYENFQIDYKPLEEDTYELKVIMKNDFVICECRSDETLLVAMEKAKIKAPSMCRVGICGYCRSILLEGKVKMVGGSMEKDLSENDYIHPCVTYPESDIVLRLDI